MEWTELVEQFEHFVATREPRNDPAWRESFVAATTAMGQAYVPFDESLFPTYSDDSFDMAWVKGAMGRILVIHVKQNTWSMYWVDKTSQTEVVRPSLKQLNDRARWFFGEASVPKYVEGS
jgi:hypothetical protein